MTADTNPVSRDSVETTLQALENGDAIAAASVFVDDGVFIHPQYPGYEYRGRESIREAFEWALTNILDEPEFGVRTYLESARTCALEVVTHHVGHDGSDVEVPRVFVVEVADGGIERWRTYLPFSPAGPTQRDHFTIQRS